MVRAIKPLPDNNRNSGLAGLYFNRRSLIKTARELGYGEDIIAQLKAAKDEIEAERIMRTARKKSGR